MALADYILQNQYGMQPQATQTPAGGDRLPSYQQGLRDPTEMVSSSLEDMLDPSSRYIQNARQRGIEYAAQRGGINSSIAAGAAERSAIEAAAPLAAQAVNIAQQREQVAAEDWLTQQNFNRSIQAELALAPVRSTIGMLEMVQQASIQDPLLYTPEVVSGYSNFFQKNMKNIMDNYFDQLG